MKTSSERYMGSNHVSKFEIGCEMNAYQIIRQALVDKKIIVATYEGRERIMCPHVIGTNKQGREQALCYQFGGESKSRPIQPDGSPNNWRCVEIAKLSNMTTMNGPWHTAPNYSRPQTCVVNVDVDVDAQI